MRLRPIRVIGANGQLLPVSPGQAWPAPYRGSRYTVQAGRGLPRVSWKHGQLEIHADPSPRALADAVRAVKGSHGSIRVTAHGAVITRVPVARQSRWEPRYVGVYTNDLLFPGIDTAPGPLEPGMYWTGFPFCHGEYWRISPSARSGRRLAWRSRGRTFRSTEEYPELIETCLDLRPSGGRIYMTESGSVWMNLPDGGVAPEHRERLQSLQRRHLDQLWSSGRHATLRLLHERIEATRTRPVYVGRIDAFDHGEPPWTSFSSTPPADDGRED